ncbi:MAG: Dyp-type peroxidase [Rhodobacterales bacterium]|nr:Dyp-type peroxidase [Rhodobacterales bacterium]
MSTPQPGIFADTRSHHYALEYSAADVAPDQVGGVIARLQAALAGIDHVIGLGAEFYAGLAGDRLPADLKPFDGVPGPDGPTAPVTGGDLLVWVKAPGTDLTFDAARAADGVLDGPFTRTLEQPGFMYHDLRDLTGFVDGLANPKGDDRLLHALVPDGQPGAGGAYWFTQKWVHDLESFNALPVKEQEGVIGRTKVDSIELEGDAMPPTSHVARTDVKVDGVAQKIWRRSFPFGGMDEHGLYFQAFACHPGRIDIQLQRMFGVSGDGLHDRLVEFSKPVTGAYWFAPSLGDLAALAG